MLKTASRAVIVGFERPTVRRSKSISKWRSCSAHMRCKASSFDTRARCLTRSIRCNLRVLASLSSDPRPCVARAASESATSPTTGFASAKPIQACRHWPGALLHKGGDGCRETADPQRLRRSLCGRPAPHFRSNYVPVPAVTRCRFSVASDRDCHRVACCPVRGCRARGCRARDCPVPDFRGRGYRVHDCRDCRRGSNCPASRRRARADPASNRDANCRRRCRAAAGSARHGCRGGRRAGAPGTGRPGR